MTDRLYRSPTDRVIAGVAGGLAVWLNVDPSLVRIAWVLLGILSGGIFVLVYFVMMIVVPLPPPGWVPGPRGPAAPPGWTPSQPGTGAVPGWDAGRGSSWDASGGPAGTPPQQGGWTPSPPGSAGPAQQPWVAPKVDSGAAGIVAGAVLVVLGVWFLMDRYVDIDWDLVWPVLVIVLGGVLIVGATRRRRGTGT